MMDTHRRLALVVVTAPANTSNVVHISGAGSRRGTPGRTEWRDLMRRIVKTLAKDAPGNASG